MLSGSREPSEIPPEERAMVQSLIDEVYGQFKEVVAAAASLRMTRTRNARNWPTIGRTTRMAACCPAPKQ